MIVVGLEHEEEPLAARVTRPVTGTQSWRTRCPRVLVLVSRTQLSEAILAGQSFWSTSAIRDRTKDSAGREHNSECAPCCLGFDPGWRTQEHAELRHNRSEGCLDRPALVLPVRPL
eukprot:3590882-Prymnesium_polylepis.1